MSPTRKDILFVRGLLVELRDQAKVSKGGTGGGSKKIVEGAIRKVDSILRDLDKNQESSK